MTSNGNDMPDPDAIKMFVGQIPKTWNENDVRMYFEQFGPIYMVNVLRDKVTKQSRGIFPNSCLWDFKCQHLINYTSTKFNRPYIRFQTGACFILWFARKSALEAQNTCHNLKTLPGVRSLII